jgi:hypothetical protein
MGELTDEVLMSYADGALEPHQRAKVELCLRRDPDAARRLEAFRATGPALRYDLDALLALPVPERLFQSIRETPLGDEDERAPMRSQANGRASMADLWRRPSEALARLLDVIARPPVLGAVAVAALILVAGLGHVLWRLSNEVHEEVEPAMEAREPASASGGLAGALEHQLSGMTVQFKAEGEAISVRPKLTFASRKDSYCRQYELERKGETLEGLACRQADGTWLIESEVIAQPRKRAPDHFAPAAGQSNSIIEKAIDGLIVGEVLALTEEEAVIGRHWNGRAE